MPAGRAPRPQPHIQPSPQGLHHLPGPSHLQHQFRDQHLALLPQLQGTIQPFNTCTRPGGGSLQLLPQTAKPLQENQTLETCCCFGTAPRGKQGFQQTLLKSSWASAGCCRQFLRPGRCCSPLAAAQRRKLCSLLCGTSCVAAAGSVWSCSACTAWDVSWHLWPWRDSFKHCLLRPKHVLCTCSKYVQKFKDCTCDLRTYTVSALTLTIGMPSCISKGC